MDSGENISVLRRMGLASVGFLLLIILSLVMFLYEEIAMKARNVIAIRIIVLSTDILTVLCYTIILISPWRSKTNTFRYRIGLILLVILPLPLLVTMSVYVFGCYLDKFDDHPIMIVFLLTIFLISVVIWLSQLKAWTRNR